MDDEEPEAVVVRSTDIVAQSTFSTLQRSVVDYTRRDGRRQTLVREAYDHGDGAAILLHDATRDRVLLVRQWRFGAHVNPGPGASMARRGWLVEVPAGLLDGREPLDAIRSEAMEEVGVRLTDPTLVFECYMSPGSLTERVALFLGSYRAEDRIGPGGGLVAEGEDIEILEPTLEEALEMVRSGAIADLKTIVLLYALQLRRMGAP